MILRKQVSFHGSPTRPISEEIWTSVFKALRNDRVLRIQYQSTFTPGITTRDIEPIHLACVEGEWYLVAFDRTNNGMRYFTLPRVKSVKVLPEMFAFHDFDPDKHFANRFGRFIGEPDDTYEIVVQFDKAAVPWVMERQWHPKQKMKMNKDGSMQLSFPAPSLFEVKRWVLQWGSEVRVLKPAELHDDLKQETSLMRRRS